MDRAQFDALTRLVAARGTRRAALGAFLGGLLFGHDLPVAEAKRRRGQGRSKAGKGKHKGEKRGKARQDRGQKARAEAATCCASGNCTPGKGKNLQKCCYQGQDLSGRNFQGANLGNANFSGAILTNANFRGANLGQTCFVDAVTTGASFGGTNLSTAIFCRTQTSQGVNNSGCGKGTPCCPTCDDEHPCGEDEICCDGRCRGGECCDDGDCGGATPNCCNGACQECCNGSQCPQIPCQTWGCAGATCVQQGTDPDLTACNAFSPDQGVCCGGTCTEGSCCADANCTGNSNRCVDLDGSPAATQNTCVCGNTGAACSGATPACCGTAPNGICTDLQSDVNNCGICGNTCNSGESCCSGVCATPTTCAALGRTCGTAPDGCGGTLECGVCPSGTTPSCNNGACAACSATCPGCAFCFNLAEGDTVCGIASDVRCAAPCSSSADCPGDRPFCIASTTIRSSGATSPISSICTTAPIAAACSAITPC